MIHFEVRGNPIAKARPRFARRGKFVKTYNPQESEEGLWMAHAIAAMPKEPLSGPLRIEARFEMPIPASWSNKKRAEAQNGLIPHTKKPDLDNLVKFVKDCLNGSAWVDDSQVVEMEAFKRFAADYPKTEIMIFEK